MRAPAYQPGDKVIYCKTKHSTSPGPRATDIHPAPHGDGYSYEVDKFWIVDQIQDDGRLVLRTRRGKRHVVSATDPNLRPAGWWDRIFRSRRFPQAQPDQAAAS